MQTFRVGLVTWNAGGCAPGTVPAAPALLRPAAHCDVVVVGLQEVALGSRGWKAALRAGLGPDWAYVGGESYAGMRVKAFARLSPRLPAPALQLRALSAQDAAAVGLSVRAGRFPVVGVTGPGKRVGAGVADRWPNKGAVALEIRFGAGCRAVFVVAHLAANEDRVQGRQDDWKAILRRLDRDELPLARGTDPVIAVPLFHRYEHVFVLGDLNYRIAPPGTEHAARARWVRERAAARDWAALVAADQLCREQRAHKVFANFQEGPITFPPTFKVDPRTGAYSPARVPSYCDRILWHSLPARIDLVRCVRYTSLPSFRHSDHLPVLGEYELRVPIVVAPPRPLAPRSVVRLVLEFMLVRFVKGTDGFSDRQFFTDGPPSMRHIKEPDSLKLRVASPASLRAREGCSLVNGLPDDDDDDEDDEDEADLDDVDEEEEGDDEEEDTSSLSSEDEENYPENDTDSDNGYYSPYEGPDAFPEAEVPKELFARPPPTIVAGASMTGGHRYDINLANSTLRHNISVVSSADTGTPSPRTARQYSFPGDMSSSDKTPVTPASSGTLATTATPATPASPATPATPASHRIPMRESPHPAVHANSGPRKRESLSRQCGENGRKAAKNKKASKRRRLNGMRMEVHGQGLFLKQGRVYRVSIPKRVNGSRERIGESLPVIPLAPISSLADLEYRHVLVEFAKKKTRVGTSGALPLKALLPYVNELYAFELSLTKYGRPVGIMEACVQLTVSDSSYWEDAKGRIVRNSDGGPSKLYRGPLPVRKRTRARSKAEKRSRADV